MIQITEETISRLPIKSRVVTDEKVIAAWERYDRVKAQLDSNPDLGYKTVKAMLAHIRPSKPRVISDMEFKFSVTGFSSSRRKKATGAQCLPITAEKGHMYYIIKAANDLNILCEVKGSGVSTTSLIHGTNKNGFGWLFEQCARVWTIDELDWMPVNPNVKEGDIYRHRINPYKIGYSRTRIEL